MTPVWEALGAVLPLVKTVDDCEEVPTWKAVGAVLCEDLEAPWDFPPRLRAAYDGYAVDSASTPGTFRVVARVPVGTFPEVTLGKGEAAYVTTGAYLPDGSDAVVPQEAVEVRGDTIVVKEKYTPGKNADQIGEYVRSGERLLGAGTVITELDAAALLDVAITKVKVRRRLRVGVVSTGSELIVPGDPHEAAREVLRGKVVETTGTVIRSLLPPYVSLTGHAVVPDDYVELGSAVDRLLESSDALMLVGGTGPSEVDLFHEVAAGRGPRAYFRGLLMRPGRPTSLAVVGDKPIVGLSGHPVSAIHGYFRVVEPLLERMAGVARPPPRPFVHARLGSDVDAQMDLMLRVALRWEGDELWAFPIKKQQSTVTTSLLMSDGLAFLERGLTARGTPVRTLLVRGLRDSRRP